MTAAPGHASPPRASLTKLADWVARDAPAGAGHWLGRFLILRLLGLVYLMAFLTLVNQGRGLIGAHGLLPAADFLDQVAAQLGGRGAAFWEMPSLFWLGASDRALAAVGWVGVALSLGCWPATRTRSSWRSCARCTSRSSRSARTSTRSAGRSSSSRPASSASSSARCSTAARSPRPAPAPVVWLLRWLIVRVMWGAGLIKLRGDPCWRDLTCLDFHFETQPIPSPLTPAFHFLPPWAHKLGVLFNHVVELAAPFFVLAPQRRLRLIAGALMAALQIVLIASGNLSFLNWLTLVPILACFDDGLWRRLLPRALVARAERAQGAALPSRAQGATTAVLALVVAVLSIGPVLNLLSGSR